MLITPALFAAVIVASLGALILWSNPSRKVNWTVSLCSFQIAGWLFCLHLATIAALGQGLYWVRWACAVGGTIPLSFWLVKEAILDGPDTFKKQWLTRAIGWLLFTAVLVWVTFTEYFVPRESTHDNRVHGPGYYAYMWTLLGLYAVMFAEAFRKSRTLSGGRKLELQIWLGGGCLMVSSVIVTMALNALTGDRLYIRIQPMLVLLFYGAIAFAITAHRIFDARQIILLGIEKAVLVMTVAGTAYALDRVFLGFLPELFAFLATTAVSLWLAVSLNGWLDRRFQFYPQATSARQAVFAVAHRESRLEDLRASFVGVLKGWGQSEHALLLSGTQDLLVGGGVELPGDGIIVAALRQLRWATPERLTRERATAERNALMKFLQEQGMAVLVIAEGRTLTTIAGTSVGVSRRPFTYPQVTQLMELTSIMAGALERAHFSAKVQHTEQLATVGLLGASLAHEIRNPLVSIKTFVQLLPKHHGDPAFREKFFKLIGDEVGRIDQLTEQLLDLASPRTYSAAEIELHPILRASVDLVAAKAAHKRIELVTDFQATPDRAYTDASAAKQVMLNLCFNAIQAAETVSDGQRWVKIATRNTATGIEMAVADSGPGIAPEIRPRLFQPFQTTKSSGFGLGLAICSDILANLNASISVDPPQAGHGATFRVTFPCQPSSS